MRDSYRVYVRRHHCLPLAALPLQVCISFANFLLMAAHRQVQPEFTLSPSLATGGSTSLIRQVPIMLFTTSFLYSTRKGPQVLGYTIMLNHVHLLLFFNGGEQSLNTVSGNGKRFIGYQIIKRLQQQNDAETLRMLAQGVSEVA